MKKKVLFFLQSGVGGAERVTVTIAKYLDTTKFEVKFCIVDRPLGKTTIDVFIPAQYSKVRIPNVKGLKQLRALYGVLRCEKPDFVFSSIMHTNTKLLALSVFFPKIKFIVRNNNYVYTLSKKQKFILKYTYCMADVVVAQTEEMKDELIREMNVPEGKIKVLQNPIDVDTIDSMVAHPSPYEENGKIRYVASGRFVPAKGFDVLIRAFDLVKREQADSELFIVGNIDGVCSEYYGSIKKLVRELGLDESVHCLGFQKNPYIYIKNADCFVLSSRNEGLPNVLIEALYLGIPVAATKCIPVILRIVDDTKNGFLAESEDPESLAEAMLKASKLGRITSRYQSACCIDFQNLFE